IDEQKKEDTRWIVARDWDDDNMLTCLFWMTPSQVKNWIQYSDCILNDITHKTNRSKEYWAYLYTSFKFTKGIIATSRVKATNACLKKFLYGSNMSLYELMQKIHHILDCQDKESEYLFWKLVIPSIK
ncbi:11977_t:CDS:2, partial [Cetraspora pellucida]